MEVQDLINQQAAKHRAQVSQAVPAQDDPATDPFFKILHGRGKVNVTGKFSISSYEE